jgi:NADPH:quinone reductase-like Zn-dependent oxidoreductase
MKAAVHTRYGPPDVVRIAEVDKPAAKDNEVLVRVHATTVNRTDCTLRAAKPFVNRFFTGLRRPRVTVLGNEFAGAVEAVGRGVTSLAVGDRVFGYNGTRFAGRRRVAVRELRVGSGKEDEHGEGPHRARSLARRVYQWAERRR